MCDVGSHQCGQLGEARGGGGVLILWLLFITESPRTRAVQGSCIERVCDTWTLWLRNDVGSVLVYFNQHVNSWVSPRVLLLSLKSLLSTAFFRFFQSFGGYIHLV